MTFMKSGRARALVLTVLATAGLIVGGSTPAQAAAPGHARQVTTVGFADPGFNHFGSRYYIYATGDHFPVRSSTSPTGPYSKSMNSMPAIPKWVGLSPKRSHDLWAPSVFRTTDSGRPLFVMYFTGFRKGWGANCVGVATSRSPDHGFQPVGHPICATRSDHEAIDPSQYRTADGTRWILFKTDVGNVSDFRIEAIHMRQGITPDLKTRRTIVSSPDKRMEAPSMIAHGHRVFLFLSRGDYTNCSYSTDVWSAKSFKSTFSPVRTVMSTASTGLCGPGGATVLTDGAATRIAFHAYPDHNPGPGTPRFAWVGELKWNSAGNPYLY